MYLQVKNIIWRQNLISWLDEDKVNHDCKCNRQLCKRWQASCDPTFMQFFPWSFVAPQLLCLVIYEADIHKLAPSGFTVVLLHETSFLRYSSSSTSYSTSIFTDPSKEGLMHSRTVNCSEMFTWKFGLTIITSIWTASLIQWNDRILHPCNLIGLLNFFQAREDCNQFRIADDRSPLLHPL